MARLVASCLVWPAIVVLPLALTANDLYFSVLPADWYNKQPVDFWRMESKTYPPACGLVLGILSVVIGQVSVLIYFTLLKKGFLGHFPPVQPEKGAPDYDFWRAMASHLSQPEGFVMLGGYLVSTWMLGLMPASYYSFPGGINWLHVALQLLLVDALQWAMHNIEHQFHAKLYQISHKPHHHFINPKLFDAFNGSPTDTFLMILVPLSITARLVPANVWSYMTFGALYANWLCLIHSEHVLPWDGAFRVIGLGTSSDHHVHHAKQCYNFGHLFMYWDRLAGTYKDPAEAFRPKKPTGGASLHALGLKHRK